MLATLKLAQLRAIVAILSIPGFSRKNKADTLQAVTEGVSKAPIKSLRSIAKELNLPSGGLKKAELLQKITGAEITNTKAEPKASGKQRVFLRPKDPKKPVALTLHTNLSKGELRAFRRQQSTAGDLIRRSQGSEIRFKGRHEGAEGFFHTIYDPSNGGRIEFRPAAAA